MAQDIEQYKAALARLAARSKDLLKEASIGGADLPDRISIAGNRFSLITSEGRTEAPNPVALDFCLVASKTPKSRMYYDTAFNAANPLPPLCKSYDSLTPDVDQPQSETCPTCRFSVWGSDQSKVSGKSIPACTSYKDIVIKVANVPGLWLFQLPPASHKAWGKVIKACDVILENAQRKNAPVLTSMTIIIRAEFAGTGILKFEAMGYASDAETLEVDRLDRTEQSTINHMLWSSPERKAQYEEAIAPKPRGASPEPLRGPPEPGRPPSPPPPPEPPKKPLMGSGEAPNGPQRSRRNPDPRSDRVDTDAALDEIFRDLADE